MVWKFRTVCLWKVPIINFYSFLIVVFCKLFHLSVIEKRLSQRRSSIYLLWVPQVRFELMFFTYWSSWRWDFEVNRCYQRELLRCEVWREVLSWRPLPSACQRQFIGSDEVYFSQLTCRKTIAECGCCRSQKSDACPSTCCSRVA